MYAQVEQYSIWYKTIAEDGVKANIYGLILPDTVVPTLSSKLQENIKTTVKKQTTIEIKEANVKIEQLNKEVSI